MGGRCTVPHDKQYKSLNRSARVGGLLEGDGWWGGVVCYIARHKVLGKSTATDGLVVLPLCK